MLYQGERVDLTPEQEEVTPLPAVSSEVMRVAASKWVLDPDTRICQSDLEGKEFHPGYEPHGVKMLYQGERVDLTPEQEEVMHCQILESPIK